MTGINSYSTTASENVTANTGINWDEGMAPAAVNNSARQNMADIRSRWNDVAWFQYGIGSKTVAAVYASATSFTLAGGDATAHWHTGRRVKAVGATTGTIYGRVSSSSFATSTTTVNVTWDSGSLSNESLTIYAGTIPVTGDPIAPESIAGYISAGSWTPGDISGGSLTLGFVSAGYTRIGNMVFAYANFTYPVTADASPNAIGGLPISTANAEYARQGNISYKSGSNAFSVLPNANSTLFIFYDSTGTRLTNAQLSGINFAVQFSYPVA